MIRFFSSCPFELIKYINQIKTKRYSVFDPLLRYYISFHPHKNQTLVFPFMSGQKLQV